MPRLLGILCATAQLVTCNGSAPHILHIVADDFGYKEIGYKNKVVETPTLDSLALGGIRLTDYYTFTVCAPSRASIMTGRYPWGIGYYWVGGDSEAVNSSYQMLPKLLKQGGYDTVAIGKWHCGAILKEHTPTGRGFDSFFGYYHAAVNSYWYHGGEGGGCAATDFSNNTGPQISGAQGQNGTYITEAFTDYAVKRIQRHDPSTPLYMYFSHKATHDAAGGGIQAPLGTVQRYPRIKEDTYKVQAAATTELDWSVGNVTQALQDKGMWENTVVIFMSDNGGPLGHTVNEPLRGGKHTYWEGGLRAEAFVYSELLPKKVRGAEWSGLMHSSDWYPTLIEGVAGLTIPDDTGPRAVDGFNLWPAFNSQDDSPRNEVISQIQNEYSVGHGSQASIIRRGDFKLIIGDPGDSTLVAYPDLADQDVDFGSTGGILEDGSDHCTGKGIKLAAPALGGDKPCTKTACLFNVKDDPSESNDLAGHSKYASLITDLTAALDAAAKTGPPFAETFEDKKDDKAAKAQICAIATGMGFVEPADCDTCGSVPPVPPSPSPSPSPAPPSPGPPSCIKACEKDCPSDSFKSYDDCLKCTRDSSECTGKCKPKERKAFCGAETSDFSVV